MSMLMDTIKEINALRHQLEQEEGRIQAFLSSNQKADGASSYSSSGEPEVS